VPTLIFNAKHCRRHTSDTILSSTTSDRGGSPRLPMKRFSRDAERRRTGIHWRFAHDGAPAHILPAVRQFWNSLFPEHRTARCGLLITVTTSAACRLCYSSQRVQHWQQRTQCGSRGFTASEAPYCDEQFAGTLFCASEMPHGWTAHSLL
jgi:hypothetical protein